MNIIVCIKQVPDTESQIKIASDNKSIDLNNIKWVINPYDEFAIEEALRIQKAHGGEVTVIGIGPKRVTESLRTALAMGCDKAILVEDEGFYNIDPIKVSKILAEVISHLNSDIILLGQRAIDDDSGIVGSALSELLHIPQVSVVSKLEINNRDIIANRIIEGMVLVIKTTLPAIITTQKGLNEPRYASLPGIMKAKKKPLDIKKLSDINIDDNTEHLEIINMHLPKQRTSSKQITGETPKELAENLIKVLHEDIKII